jgi:hypothetical protein
MMDPCNSNFWNTLGCVVRIETLHITASFYKEALEYDSRFVHSK